MLTSAKWTEFSASAVTSTAVGTVDEPKAFPVKTKL